MKIIQLEHNTQSAYTPDIGEVPEGSQVLCGVCSSVMDETRNCNGPRGWAMAMTGGKSPHDSFFCPHREEQWHRQVVALRQEAKNSVSGKIAAMLEAEAEEIMSTREATKEVGWGKGY